MGPFAPHVIAVAAAVALTLSAGLQVRAYRRIHPSLTAEQAELARFVPPPGAVVQSTTSEVTATPYIMRTWSVGEPGPICDVAVSSSKTWAEPGTVEPRALAAFECAFVARKGADHVLLYVLHLGPSPWVADAGRHPRPVMG